MPPKNTQENAPIAAQPSSPSSSNEGSDKPKNRGGKGRRKIEIKYIQDKTRRQITFSKRKAGLMKKAYELSTLTGTQILVLVTSETGHVYTFATKKFQPFITDPKGKTLIQQCLSASEIEMSERPDGDQEEGERANISLMKDVKMDPSGKGGQVISHGSFPQDYQGFNNMPVMGRAGMNNQFMPQQFHQSGQSGHQGSEGENRNYSNMGFGGNIPHIHGNNDGRSHVNQFFNPQLQGNLDQQQRDGRNIQQPSGNQYFPNNAQGDESSQQKY